MHRDAHKYLGNFGAYGTGKTLTSREEVLKHIFITDNANVLIGANVASQYEQTIKRELEADLPFAFVSAYSNQKSYMDVINGARVAWRPFDDPDKLRSYNLTMFVIVEGSEVDGEVFHQLKTRLRHMAASVQAKNEYGELLYEKADNGAQIPIIETTWNKGIVESNPDSGWIRTDILYSSDEVHRHGRVLDDTVIMERFRDPAISTHVASTDVNKFLPKDFIEQISKNKPAWWVNRFVFSSFSYAEGLVYPTALSRIVPYFAPDPKWKRVIAADYGLSDDFVYLYAAVDQKTGIVYIYKEVSTNNKNIEELSTLYHDNVKDIPSGGLYCAPLLDPKSGAKRDYNKKTLYDHFLDYGIAFQPGTVQIDARIMRVNTYLESGRLRIMDNCIELIEELRDYRFPRRKLTGNTRAQDKPVDKNNHRINPLEWICCALPKDPKDLVYGAYDTLGHDLTKVRDKVLNAGLPWALQDESIFQAPQHTLLEGEFEW